MLVPIVNRGYKNKLCKMMLEFSCRNYREFTDDDIWIINNFSIKISSTLYTLYEYMNKLSSDNTNVCLSKSNQELI